MPQQSGEALQLPRTGLRIEGDVLVKSGPDGEVIARDLLEDIRRVETTFRFSAPLVATICLWLCGFVASLILVAVGGAIWFASLILFCLLPVELVAAALPAGTAIRIRFGRGEVSYLNREGREECQAFVAAVRSLVEERRSNRPRKG